MKVYIVETIDEWNNTTLFGFYSDLKDAEVEIKKAFEHIENIDELELSEYPSTFGSCFNTEVVNDETGEYVRVFGYIETLSGLEERLDEIRKANAFDYDELSTPVEELLKD